MSMTLLLSLLVGQTAPPAAPPSAVRAEPDATIAADRFREQMAAYEIRVGSDRQPLAMQDEPVLNWNNPARYGEDGALFVWTRDGRPEALGTAFTFRVGQSLGRAHEFHSLAAEPVTAVSEGVTAWAPRKPGLTFERSKDVPRPAASEPGRLIQMRAIAREYDVDLIKADGETTRLRLVPQPLVRYAAPKRGVTDGAIFSYAISTDPEAILVLEARGEGKAAEWFAAFGRFHYETLRATRRDKVVWEADRRLELEQTQFGDGRELDGPYIIFRFLYTSAEPTADAQP